MAEINFFLEVAIDTPLRRRFDYRAPPSPHVDVIKPGMRVRVPFGRRRVIGIVLATKTSTAVAADKLKTVIEVLDAQPLFDAKLLALLVWAAEYYHHPIGAVLAAALPNNLRSGAPQIARRDMWQLNADAHQRWSELLPSRAARLRAIAQALVNACDAATLSQVHVNWRASLRELQKRGWVEQRTEDVLAQASSALAALSTPHQLAGAQLAALEKILSARAEFRTWLLHGVTGSGKTEIYLQAIAAVIAAGQQALVLVPEISLTPQLIERFQSRFSVPLAVLHSALSDSERLNAWRAARSGAAGIVIGTRSAVFAPLRELGIVIVDEEHDASYKQQEGFRYSARDLAIARAQRQGVPVVLGSATPSLESLERALRQPDDLIVLPQRAGNAQPPSIRLIDLRKHAHTNGIATPTLLRIQEHLHREGQVLLYLNRRGFAPTLFCVACGWSAACSRCDARMTVHHGTHNLICHHCGLETAIPEHCGSCGQTAKPVGQGTERIENTIADLFPNVPLARIDRDSVRRKQQLEDTLAAVHSGATRILIGTQMLTKGHHFPNVTLVVVLNADQGLFGTDFRASERLAQSIVQVAGRAGRAERAGEVLIQTEYPEHPLLGDLLSGGYRAFAERALNERQHAHWPPYSRLALLRAESVSMQRAMNFLDAARDCGTQLRNSAVRFLGPVSAPMAKRAGRYRAQLLLQAATHAPLQKLLRVWLTQIETLPQASRVRWSIDIDPAELF